MERPVEISWFGALCDDDYEFLGVPDAELASSWEHCRDIVLAADRLGYDNILLPSGYELGIDSVAFAGGVAPLLDQMHLLVAVRIGEMWLPQLARQLATLDHMSGGRLTINIISSDLPGQQLESEARYERTAEAIEGLRTLLDGHPLELDGEHHQLDIAAPRVARDGAGSPPMYFGGFSEAAKNTAARHADVFLTWPDTVESVATTVADMRARAAEHGRQLRCGLRAHVIVRETNAEARAAADRLVSRLDDREGERIRQRSLDSTSAGVARQAELRDTAGDDGYAEPLLWTGIGRARSGAGAALVGDPTEIAGRLRDYVEVGVDAFILSGYPHRDECERFARLVLPLIDHEALRPRWSDLRR